MDLPVGSLRIRKQGTSGGHNGLKSIEKALGSEHYPRIKVGIGHPLRVQEAVVSHVLHRFEGTDRETIARSWKRRQTRGRLDEGCFYKRAEPKIQSKKSSGRKRPSDKKDLPAAAGRSFTFLLLIFAKNLFFHAATGRRGSKTAACCFSKAGRKGIADSFSWR